jgi:hypothetical protein
VSNFITKILSHQGQAGADMYINDDNKPSQGGTIVSCFKSSTSRNLFCNGLKRIFESPSNVNTDCKVKGVAGIIGGGVCNV